MLRLPRLAALVFLFTTLLPTEAVITGLVFTIVVLLTILFILLPDFLLTIVLSLERVLTLRRSDVFRGVITLMFFRPHLVSSNGFSRVVVGWVFRVTFADLVVFTGLKIFLDRVVVTVAVLEGLEITVRVVVFVGLEIFRAASLSFRRLTTLTGELILTLLLEERTIFFSLTADLELRAFCFGGAAFGETLLIFVDFGVLLADFAEETLR